MKKAEFSLKKLSIIFISVAILWIALFITSKFGGTLLLTIRAQTKESPFLDSPKLTDFSVIQDNSYFSPLLAEKPLKTVGKIKMVITAYSSTPWETDGNPFITASGSCVREGIVANNLLPFGTKIRIPELYGDKIFVVEDRMNWKKGYYHLDIWFPNYQEAKNFGAKKAYVEILEG